MEAVDELPERLEAFWSHYRPCFQTRTRDQSGHAYDYLSSQLRLTTDRNFATIGRTVGEAGENIQHFMSNSPWLAGAVYKQVQADITATPALQTGGVVIVDESADAKAGPVSAGAARQRNGRLGKVDLCQVGVFLAFVKGPVWTWVDCELFLPEAWFTPEYAPLRQRVELPEGRTFQTKIALAWQMIQRAQQNGLPFEMVACDDLYGRSNPFRSQLAQAGLLYAADVPCDTQVYLTQPVWGVPARCRRRGRHPTRPRVLSPDQPVTVQQVTTDRRTEWRRLRVRPCERGELVADYAARRIWTLRDGQPTAEWLLMRREAGGKIKYVLLNAPAATPLEHLAWREAQRYFVERTIQDSKSEMGWDEFQAIKFPAWEHQAALTVLASWFVAQTKLEWAERFPQDPHLVAELGVDRLPGLSVANVCELLRAAMPLPHLSKQEARALVVTHLLNRTRSRRSRMKRAHTVAQQARDPT